MPREARDFFLSFLQLAVRCLASRLECLVGVTMDPLSCFKAQLPLLGLLSGAVDFVMHPIFDSTNVYHGTFPFLLRGGKPSSAFHLESFELARLLITKTSIPRCRQSAWAVATGIARRVVAVRGLDCCHAAASDAR